MELTSYPKPIQVFFAEIVEKIKQELQPDFIIIAGSFGKESWLYSDSELISDFEFVFVCKKSWSLKKKNALLKKLNKEYSYDISLKGFLLDKIRNNVISNYAFKNPGYISLDFFDTFSNPVVLFAKNGQNLKVDCSVSNIPIWEAWRLYVNRIGDLLKLEKEDKLNDENQDYFWLKIFESTAGAYCIIHKKYHKKISKRLEIFNEDFIRNDKELSDVCKNSFSIIKSALEARNNHELAHFKTNLSIYERKVIVNSWMTYFEQKLAIEEEFSSLETAFFNNSYLKKKKIQNKYLGFNYYFNKMVSNGVRFLYNPRLLNFSFKFYNQTCSWRHIVLLSVSSLFKEIFLEKKDFNDTKVVMNNIIKTKKMKNEEVIDSILNYWRILR